MKFDRTALVIAIIGGLIGGIFVLGAATLGHHWEQKSVEAELIVIDCHLEIKEKDKIIHK